METNEVEELLERTLEDIAHLKECILRQAKSRKRVLQLMKKMSVVAAALAEEGHPVMAIDDFHTIRRLESQMFYTQQGIDNKFACVLREQRVRLSWAIQDCDLLEKAVQNKGIES